MMNIVHYKNNCSGYDLNVPEHLLILRNRVNGYKLLTIFESLLKLCNLVCKHEQINDNF
jgi:hypothetical protein